MKPGYLAFIGSGETTVAGGQVFESIARTLPEGFQASVVETPAGFELNSSMVASRVSDFLRERLQNYRPTVNTIPARKKGTAYSPDSPDIVRPLFASQLIYLGAGSPSYTVRQLSDSLAWQTILARHAEGAALILASAAAISAGRLALPVYEIYKVGEELHWKPGLNLMQAYGLSLVIVPHWNNNDGGENLDTRYCFMGKERFLQLSDMLSPQDTVLGLDEHTCVIIDLPHGTCRVTGKDSVHILKDRNEIVFHSDQEFSLSALGNFRIPERSDLEISENIWSNIREAHNQQDSDRKKERQIPEDIAQIVRLRQKARDEHNWIESDHLRKLLRDSGWQVNDTPQGQALEPIP